MFCVVDQRALEAKVVTNKVMALLIFILEQTDENTPIHDKKFRLPSSGEESLTPSVTPVVNNMCGSVDTEKGSTSKTSYYQ